MLFSFNSLYIYVRDLHLWHTKTEKQLQDKKGLGKCRHKNQSFFPTESPSDCLGFVTFYRHVIESITVKWLNDTSCVKAYFSSDSHSIGEKRGAACFHNTLSFALHGIWRALYYLFEVSKYKGTKNKGIIGTTQVEILIYWTGANTCFSAQSYDFMKV